MFNLENKEVLVVGLGARGRAACELLSRSGARVTVVDEANTDDLRVEAGKLRSLGIQVELGATVSPEREFNFAVVSPSISGNNPMVLELLKRKVNVIGEFELGFQQSKCLSIAIAGTNGKGTTAEL